MPLLADGDGIASSRRLASAPSAPQPDPSGFHHGLLDDPLFHEVGLQAIASDGRAYWLDTRDQNVNVLNADGEHLKTFGAAGQGPGEIERASRVDVYDERVWVYDRYFIGVHVFSLEGEYLYRVRFPEGVPMQPKDFLVIGSEEILLSYGSVEEEFYGRAIHRFQLIETALDERNLVHVGSFGEAPEYEPAIYGDVVGGRLARDLDGGILYAQANPYELRKYDREGALIWRLSDADAMRRATDYFVVTKEGRIGIRAYAASMVFASLDDNWYVHQMAFPSPPEEYHLPPTERTYRWVYEVLRRNGRQAPINRVRFESDRWLFFKEADGRGNLYGTWSGPGLDIPIRTHVRVRRRDQQQGGAS